MVKCPVCGREFSIDGALAQHVKDKHGTEETQQRTAEDRPEKQKRKTLKKRNRHPVAIGLVVVAVAMGLGLYYIAAPSFRQPPYACITEGTYIHVHPYLQIWIEGKNVSVPADVGIVRGGTCLQPIHTHDSTGILHIELSQAQASETWTLGDFFNIWAFTCSEQTSGCPTLSGSRLPVIFNQTDIMGFRADATHRVVLLVDGQPSSDWGSLNLEHYDYCSASIGNVLPCNQSAGGDPAWNGTTGNYPYGTGHKIVVEYVATG